MREAGSVRGGSGEGTAGNAGRDGDGAGKGHRQDGKSCSHVDKRESAAENGEIPERMGLENNAGAGQGVVWADGLQPEQARTYTPAGTRARTEGYVAARTAKTSVKAFPHITKEEEIEQELVKNLAAETEAGE